MRRIAVAQPMFLDSDVREIQKSVAAVLKSGWLTSGALVEKLESRFRRFTGSNFAIALNSGTASLHAMVASLYLNPRDEVVVPANTFASTANAVLYTGATPVLADCDPDTFNVNVETIAAKVTDRTKGVIVTHVAGNPCEMDEIARYCRGRGIVLMEDAAHAMGSKYKGAPCGSLSWAGAFSLYPTKILTSAEGGVLVTDSESLRDFARLFRNVGRAAFGSGPIEILGYNYRMSDVHAAIGLSQFSHLRQFISKRNALAKTYGKALRRDAWLRPQRVAKHSLCSYYAYIVRLAPDSPISREELAASLGKKGIQTTVMFHPIHAQPYFRKISGGVQSLPNAEMVGMNSLVLPLHPMMTSDDVEYVAAAIHDASEGR